MTPSTITNIKITRQGTIAKLRAMGLPALPVAPAQSPHQFPARTKTGEIILDSQQQPKPAFTGKNPSYLDRHGIPRLISHRQFQERLPSDQELTDWFAHPDNGVMTMGGWQNIIWIDVDVKRYPGQGRCDYSVQQWLQRYPILQETWTERTQSGGWRFALKVEEMPSFTNFGFRRGQHLGEILGMGKLTVLAPTIGPNGKPYVRINHAHPIHIKDVSEIGLKSAKAFFKQVKLKILPSVAGAGTVSLDNLLSQMVQHILAGQLPYEDRSLCLTIAAKESYGWENWTASVGIPIAGAADVLVAQVGANLGIDPERVHRILETIDRGQCLPGIVKAGGEVAAWQRVKWLNWDLYRAACPETIQSEIRQHQQSKHAILSKSP
jgi:hypothetical protein